MTEAPSHPGEKRADAVFRRWFALGRRWFPDVFTLLVFLLPWVCFAGWLGWSSPTSYYVRMTVEVDRLAVLQIYFDSGAGYSEDHSVRVDISPGGPQEKRFPIAANQLKALRFDPADGPVDMHLHNMAIRSKTVHWFRSQPVCKFDLKALKAGQSIAEITPEDDGGVHIITGENNDDPYCLLTPDAPLSLGQNWWCLLTWGGLALGGWLLVWAGGAEAIRRLPPGALATAARPLAVCTAGWRRLSSVQAIWLVACASVALSCYPVIFFGKSFCSPNFEEGTHQLYGRFPTLPGTTDTVLANGHGADLGSMAWAHGPYAVVESRSIFRDHEWPLWNRYNYCGLPLLGQGQCMFGDPLHFIVLAAGGQSWSWDTKFVLAKLLFAAGVGLLVLLATGSQPAALLLCFSSAFLGFFSYRLNHPGYFSLCYAPWILVAWLRIVGAADWRTAMWRAGGLILANWIVMNSGTAKEAYMDLGCLNLTGVALLLFSRRTVRDKGVWLLGLAVAGVIFCLLAAPVLAAFCDTLKNSVSNYDERHAWQLQPGMFIGLFDDIFYRQLNLAELHQDPSANFFVLLGTLLALANFKRLISNRVFAAVALCALLPAALAFGVVPPSIIRQIPLLGNVVHVDNTFSCVLLIHLFVLAGFGVKACLVHAARRDWSRDVFVALLLGGALLALYFGFIQAAQHTSAYAFLQIDQEVVRSRFFDVYVPLLVVVMVMLPFVLRRLRLDGPRMATVVLLGICLFLLHWRAGLQLPNPFGQYTPVLPNRVDLLAKSDTTDFLRNDSPDAFRVFGLDSNLMLGYSGVIDLENIIGPDALVNKYYREIENAGMKSVDGWFNQPVDEKQVTDIKPFCDLLNVSYFLVSPGDNLADVPGVELARQGDLDVYRSTSSWPRAFFVNRLGLYGSVGEFCEQVAGGDGQPFASIEQNELAARPDLAERFPADQAGRKVVPGSHYRLTGNTTSFDLDVPEPGVIVLTEAYIPHDFSATVNGQDAPVFRVNHAFKGIIATQPGQYHVTFTYRPRFFSLALCAACLGLCLWIAAVWWLRRLPVPADTYDPASS